MTNHISFHLILIVTLYLISDLKIMEFRNVLFYLIVKITLVVSDDGYAKEKFTEELYLKPLPNGDLLAHFSFDITSSNNLHEFGSENGKEFLSHFNLMPKVVGEFLTDHALEGKIITIN